MMRRHKPSYLRTACVALSAVAAILYHPSGASAQFDAVLRQVIGAAISQGRMQPAQRPLYAPQQPSAGRQAIPEGPGPSFDCRNRTDLNDLTICRDRDLSRMDREMANAFVSALRGSADPQLIKAGQRAWLDQRRQCQDDRECLRAAYRQRTAQLRGSGDSGAYQDTVTAPNEDDRFGETNRFGASALILPNLPTFKGRVVIGASPGSEDEKWFRLVALGVNPGLLEDDPQGFAQRFLPRTNPYNTSDAWRGANEFRSADIRSDFLRTYANAFQRAAIRLPTQFVQVREIGFGRYDKVRHGFPLFNTWPPNLPILNDARLQVDIEPGASDDFWPIEEPAARQLLDQSQKIGRHFITVASVIALRPNERRPGTLSASLTHAYLLDPETRRVVYDFGDAALDKPSPVPSIAASNPFSALVNPGVEFKPWRLTELDGAVVMNQDLTLMRLIAAGNVDRFLNDQQYFYQRVGLAEDLLNPVTYASIFYAGSNFRGNNEFDKNRSLERFVELLPAIKRIAPKVPFDVTITRSHHLSPYNRDRGGFLLAGSQDFGLNEPARSVGLTLAPSFSWPEVFWSIPADRAEHMLKQLPDRAVVVAVRLAITAVDHATGRVQMSLRSVNIHSPKSNEILFKVPVQNDRPAGASADGDMTFKEPAALDDVFACAVLLRATDQVPDENLQFCASALWRRDAATYADGARFAGMSPTDARYPFFGRDGIRLTPDMRQNLAKWARRYTDAVARQGLVRTSNSSTRTPAGMTYDAVGRASTRENGRSALLVTEHLRPEQIVDYGELNRLPVVLILPNLVQAYTVDVPTRDLNADSDGGGVARTFVRTTRGSLLRDEAGKPYLAIFVRPERIDVTSRVTGAPMASRDLSAIPDFASRDAASSANTSGAVALDLPLIDLLTARYVGKALSPEAIAYLVERRWRYEASQNRSIDRYFTVGARAPTAEEAIAQAPRFFEWAQTHAPALPLTGFMNGAYQAQKTDKAVSFHIFPCIQQSIAALMASMGNAEDQVHVIREFNAECRYSEVRFPFQDPLRTFATLSGDLPVPVITALGGKEDIRAVAYVTIDRVTGSDHEPNGRERTGGDPDQGPDGTQNFVSLNLTLAGVEYRDAKTSAPVASWSKGIETKPETPRNEATNPVRDADKAQSQVSSGDRPDRDILGIKLGMSFDEAETIIRSHMDVGTVLDGSRPYDEQAKQGFIKPLTSGKLFVAKTGREMIALLDEPPAFANRVLLVWRRVYSPDGNVLPEEIMAGLKAKYGEPVMGATDLSASAHWSTAAGTQCYNFYGATRATQLSDTWYQDGKPAQLRTGNPRGMNAAPLADALFDPLNPRYAPWKSCGPYITASYLQTHGLMGPMDELTLSLSDFGRYGDAFAQSRLQLQKQNPAASSETHIKF